MPLPSCGLHHAAGQGRLSWARRTVVAASRLRDKLQSGSSGHIHRPDTGEILRSIVAGPLGEPPVQIR